jgi:hypothetical protein
MGERTRPAGIWVIVVIELANAAITLLDVLTDIHLVAGGAGKLARDSDVLRLVVLGWSGLIILAAVALWLLIRRGWVLMMLLVGVALAFNLALWWADPGRTEWLRLALNVVAAFYLNSAQVRDLFIRRHEVSRIALGGRARQ